MNCVTRGAASTGSRGANVIASMRVSMTATERACRKASVAIRAWSTAAGNPVGGPGGGVTGSAEGVGAGAVFQPDDLFEVVTACDASQTVVDSFARDWSIPTR
jgi:hypothetical protein